jgi:hypothetical protein
MILSVGWPSNLKSRSKPRGLGECSSRGKDRTEETIGAQLPALLGGPSRPQPDSLAGAVGCRRLEQYISRNIEGNIAQVTIQKGSAMRLGQFALKGKKHGSATSEETMNSESGSASLSCSGYLDVYDKNRILRQQYYYIYTYQYAYIIDGIIKSESHSFSMNGFLSELGSVYDWKIYPRV